MIWKLITLLTLIAATAFLTVVLAGAYYGEPVQNWSSTVILPGGIIFGSFCKLMAWMSDD